MSRPLHVSPVFKLARLSKGDKALVEHAFSLFALMCKEEASAHSRSAKDKQNTSANQHRAERRQFAEQDRRPSSLDPRMTMRLWGKNARECTIKTGR